MLTTGHYRSTGQAKPSCGCQSPHFHCHSSISSVGTRKSGHGGISGDEMESTTWCPDQQCSVWCCDYLPITESNDGTSRTIIQPSACKMIALNSHHGEHLVCMVTQTSVSSWAYQGPLLPFHHCYSSIDVTLSSFGSDEGLCFMTQKKWDNQLTPVILPLIFMYHNANTYDAATNTLAPWRLGYNISLEATFCKVRVFS